MAITISQEVSNRYKKSFLEICGDSTYSKTGLYFTSMSLIPGITGENKPNFRFCDIAVASNLKFGIENTCKM